MTSLDDPMFYYVVERLSRTNVWVEWASSERWQIEDRAQEYCEQLREDYPNTKFRLVRVTREVLNED